ncbi:STAS/SEC14 domain-containing protein [Cellulophaga sp. Hel_I_12]|uniref:STAS/SEC14 domain-containing protein n=1 Tax=Cellulophaga sp. Hel_I_12 TaxID=1249972 RepID=UPI000646CAC8|nr:STAS/SEC14 domain-containing protein [Cellulophaga sp. Hel_I_12]|tara:strand:+ start:325 stop:681 length:357 start_codon:yes stop_codon:yes gene_type:complete
MLQIIELTNDNVIASKAYGKLRKEDIEKIHPLIHAILDKGMKVRWYFEMDNFTGWDLPGLWEDLKMDTAHAKDYEKIAMVGDKKWQEWITQFMKPFTNAEIRYFDLADNKKAKEWIEK